MEKTDNYDVIIVGGSYSGLAAGMALGRALRKVLIIDSGKPCNRQTPHSHNFLTRDGETPTSIASIGREQVQHYPTVEFANDVAVKGTRIDTSFEIETQSGKTYAAKKLVFATGIVDSMPDIPGFVECWGVSVLHCPYCHGYEVKGQKTGIIANGSNGFEFSSIIRNWTDDLTLYTNGPSELTSAQTEKLGKHGIAVVSTEIERLEHENGHLKSIIFKNGEKVSLQVLYSRRPFVQHTDIPELLGCEMAQDGYIKVDPSQKTTVQGVYACGDNTTRIRTVANAVSMGTTAGMMVNKELIDEEFA